MKAFKKIYFIPLCIMALWGLLHHHGNLAPAKKERLYVVSSKPLSKTLSFSGIIEPLKSTPINSAVEGTIYEMAFHYGDTVKKGQLLFSISSDKFQATYKTSLMQFIKAKTEYLNAQGQLKESTFLHRNQLISEDEFKSKESTFFNARLAMIQAKEDLSSVLRLLGKNETAVFNLSIEEIDKITQVLHNQNSAQRLQIRALDDGVFILPSKNGTNDSEAKKVFAGDQVKQGDILGALGDLKGLKTHIEVDEFNVNLLKLGQKVRVSETAFPDLFLEGQITAIDSQGQVNRNGIPVFPVEITVFKLSEEEKKQIHIGMSAKVEIMISSSAKISVPLSAVREKNGLAYLRVRDERSGKNIETLVKTGATTMDSVVIEANLKDGDKIVLLD